jgi:hypothetical protein
MEISIPIQFQTATNDDLTKIRSDAGNPDLTADDVVIFGRSMIARTDVIANDCEFTRESLVNAAPTFIGKPLNFDHEYRPASSQIGRIHSAWTEDHGEVTYLFVKAYAIKTESDADLHRKLLNRQHREQSMGIQVRFGLCKECGSDLGAVVDRCSKHPNAPMIVKEFSGDHVSYVGDPAVEGAGVLHNSKNNGEQIIFRLLDVENLEQASASIRELRRDAEDGRAYRELIQNEFVKWFGLSHIDASDDEIKTLANKLSATEMTRLAQIERDRVHELLPSGGRQMTVADPEDGDAVTAEPQFKNLQELFRKGI